MSNSYKILVVDDSEDIRALLDELLEDEGYNAILAEDGKTALSLAQTELPDLMLIDMSLPGGMSGWEVVRHLRQNPQFAQTPIIAVTAHASQKDREHALEVGCTTYLSKPFDTNNLLKMVASLLQPPASIFQA